MRKAKRQKGGEVEEAKTERRYKGRKTKRERGKKEKRKKWRKAGVEESYFILHGQQEALPLTQFTSPSTSSSATSPLTS